MVVKKTKLLWIVLLMLLCAGGAFAQGKAPNLQYVRGDVLVVLQNPAGDASGIRNQANRIADSTASEVIRTYSAIAAATGRNIVHLKASGKTAEQLVAEVRELPEVIGATPNFIVRALRTPDDPDFALQWAMDRIGASEAWSVSAGSEEIFVAILDTGIRYDHEDLSANMGRDKDGNFGKNLVSTLASKVPDPLDDNGHGTHLAGIIGAVGNNGIGVTGVSWTVRMLGVKVLDHSGAGSYAHVLAGLDYVLEQKKRGLNIRVANMGFGGWTAPVEDIDTDPLAIACKAVADAGVLLVAAAGNEGHNIDNAGGGYRGNRIYPASYPISGMLTVAAAAQDGTLTKFSNFGSNIDLAAPGADILSTVGDGAYAEMSGTSMSAAHVTGAAALLAASEPGLSAARLKERILEFVDKHESLSGRLSSGGSLNAGAALKNERGSLTVNMEGPAAARWSVNGKGSYASGFTATNLPAGTHVVSFSDVKAWNKPENMTVTVAANAEAAAAAVYRQQNASLWVTIEGPAEARGSLDGTETYESDRTLEKVAGKHAVSFSDVPGWDTPEEEMVTVPRNAPLAFTAVYKRQTGSVTVKLEGPGEARWSLDGAGSYASGETVADVPVGSRTVSFSEVGDWTKPQDLALVVGKDEDVSAEAAYVQHTGSITVTLEGPEEARWNINGRGLYSTGETAENITVGEHTLSFSYVRDWDAPPSLQVTVTRDSELTVKQEYRKHLGSVSVTIEGPKEARWSIEGSDVLFESGAAVEKIPVGKHSVSFSDVPNWYTPEEISVAVAKDGVATAEAFYEQHRGSVVVAVEGPSEARWSLNGEGSYASGETVKDLVVGQYTISFTEAANWDKPADREIAVLKDASSTVTGVYVQHKGSVSVTIEGPSEARWSLNGEGSYASGEVLQDLVVGEYTLSFTRVLDWDRPRDRKIVVAKEGTATLTAAYEQHTGTLSVYLEGPGGARWSVSGIEGEHADGETLKDLPVGEYTLVFSDVENWDRPEKTEELNVTISRNVTVVVSAAYARHRGMLSATVEGPAGATWSVNGEGSYGSGEVVRDLAVGEYVVSFSAVADWDKPEDLTVTVAKDSMVTLIGVYIQHEEPVTEEPAVEEPVVEEPVTAEEPVAEEPAETEEETAEVVVPEVAAEAVTEAVVEQVSEAEEAAEEVAAEIVETVEAAVEELKEAVEEPAAEEVAAEALTEEPTAEEPAVEEPAVEEEAAEEPVTEEAPEVPAEEVAVEEPAVEEPVVEEPVAEEKSAAEETPETEDNVVEEILEVLKEAVEAGKKQESSAGATTAPCD